MERTVVCLGAVNLEMLYEVGDLDGFLMAWGSDLSRGGLEILTPAAEPRLGELLPRFARPTGRRGGGPAADTARFLARLEIPVTLLGLVGADQGGILIKESLPGVNLDHLVVRGESSRAYILVDSEGMATTLATPSPDDGLREADIPPEVVAGSAFLYLSPLDGEGSPALAGHILAGLAGKLRVCFEPGEAWVRRGREALTDILDHTETLLVTEEDWGRLGGDLRRHLEWAPPVVLVQRGPRGTRMLTPVRYLDFPPYFTGSMTAADAGAVFAAGYLAGLFRGLNLPQSVRLAISLAAYALGGAERWRYPDRKVMETVISSLR
jgi:sugar/nucleoside kinase (ribokinase family)